MPTNPKFKLNDSSDSESDHDNHGTNVSESIRHSGILNHPHSEPHQAKLRVHLPNIPPNQKRNSSGSTLRHMVPAIRTPKTSTTDEYFHMKHLSVASGPDQESSDAASDDEISGTRNALPSFQHSEKKSRRRRLIEEDADDSIALQNSSPTVEGSFMDQLEKKRATLLHEADDSYEMLSDDSDSIASLNPAKKEDKRDHFKTFLKRTQTWKDKIRAYNDPIGMVATNSKREVADLENQLDNVEIPAVKVSGRVDNLKRVMTNAEHQSDSKYLKIAKQELEDGFTSENTSDGDDHQHNSKFRHSATYQCDSDFEYGDDVDELPSTVRGGVLGNLLKMYQNPNQDASYVSIGETLSGDLKDKPKSISFTDLHAHASNLDLPKFKKRKHRKRKSKQHKEARITVHIADLLHRQRFILRLCKALMMYGAPTHRLEQYMVVTSKVLEIDGQFLYIPGCMLVSFGDSVTRTSEVLLVKCDQGVNLYKLSQVHAIYKKVIHDIISVDEANDILDTINKTPDLYPAWVCVLLRGFCAAMVTPFAYGGGWINLPVAFFIGCLVPALKLIMSKRSGVYSSVFEVTASIFVSFTGRALGSIPHSNICFGAVVQGAMAMLLPGYLILTGSLEMQSKNIIAGSVRMFYAIIYFMFLGFGITLGAALFGWMYGGATNETTCSTQLSPWLRFFFIPGFAIGTSLVNQAHWTQLPVTVGISCVGSVVSYFTGLHFTASREFNSAIAAFCIGILGNLYSRLAKGLAIAAMLPAIFVQIPSGIAAQNTFLVGVQTANQINGDDTSNNPVDVSASINLSIILIQVTIGISVGLFASSMFIYPFGKKKTTLFTF